MDLLAFVAANPVEKAQEQVFSAVAQTLLGAVALLCLGVAIFAVAKLIGVQDKATARIDKQNAKVEKQTEKITELATSLTETLSGVDRALTELTNAERDSQLQAREHMNLLQQMKNSIDTVIRDAVNRDRYRRSTPPPGHPAGGE